MFYCCCSDEKVERHKKRQRKGLALANEDDLMGETGRRGKKRRKEMGSDSDEGSASWEGVRSGGGGSGEDEGEMHYLLPLKTRGGIVLQPPVPKPNGMSQIMYT